MHYAGKRTFSAVPLEEERDGLEAEPPVLCPKRIKQGAQVAALTEEIAKASSFAEVLCDKCLELDLPGILQEAYNKPYYSRKSEYRPRASNEATCPLCRMFVAINPMPAHAAQSESIGDQETKFSMTAAAYIGQTGLEKPSRLRAETEVMCLLLDPGNFGGNGFRANGGPVLLRDTERPTLFSPQIVPQQFDPDTAKSWLAYCTEQHRLLCETKLESVHGLQVIDCTTLSIESGGPGLAYVALSYVWARSGGHCGSIREESGRKWLPEKLSAVVRDSIEVTKALGYRYLWIDKFCIDQNDAATKHDQIQQMDAIYQNSALTIISAAGLDETYGLPVVSGTARRRQLVIRAEGVTVLQALKDPQHSIASSCWSTRGWTFQEALLSRRRLVFH
ncbi:HET-domain-containing protein [Apiospora aurea]|uniref:HET-domain-containing protein n=1 Tax=Apiospora aurea TaxID=335848 RepID=A0ABR1QLK9_9PEZI